MAPPSLKIFVVARHALVRDALRTALSHTVGAAVVGDAPSLHAALAGAPSLSPELILVDGEPPADLTVVRSLGEAMPSARLYWLTDAEDVAWCGLQCIPPERGLADLPYMLGDVSAKACEQCALRPLCGAEINGVRLSRRELQVAVHIADGLSSKQIAASLGIGLRTVNTYRESLSKKFGSSSAAVVTRFVMETGLAL